MDPRELTFPLKNSIQAQLQNDLEQAMAVLDENNNIIYWNDAAENLFGLPANETIGRNYTEVLCLKLTDVSHDIAAISRFLEHYDGYISYYHANGRTIPISICSDVVRDEKGSFKGIVIRFEDILQRKQRDQDVAFFTDVERNFSNYSTSEELMRELGEKIKRYYRAARLTFSDIDEDTDTINIIYDNHDPGLPPVIGERRLSDYASSALLAEEKNSGIVVVHDYSTDPRFSGQFGLFAASGSGSQVAAPFMKDGKLCFVISIQDIKPRTWSSGELELFKELTVRIYPQLERLRAVEALKKSEEKYHTLFNSIEEGFSIIELLFNEDGKPTDCLVLEVNPSHDRVTGLIGIAGKRIREFIPTIDYRVIEVFGRVALTGEPAHIESWRNEDKCCFEIHASRIGGDGSNKVALVISDITEHKLSEKAIRRSEEDALSLVEQLRQADRNKNSFLSILSHELRNPMASITMGISLLNKVAPDSKQAKQAIDVINRQASQLSHLIDDLLDVTRITNSKIVLNKETIELTELIKEVALDYEKYFTENEILLTVDIPSSPVLLEADPIRLTQTLGNLLHNAAKFNCRGGKVTVSVIVGSHPDEVVISVSDNGVGIPESALSAIFQPFVQANRSHESGRNGLGLGLSIVKGIIELHGGSINAFSQGIGKGAEFIIRLPVLHEGNALHDGSELYIPRVDKGLLILVIDDIPDIAEILGALLESLGHSVRTAASGPEGIDLARELQPDVLICDIGLPGMSGYQVAECFRSDPALMGVYLIALSGYAQQKDMELSRAAGFNLHLAKPVELSSLSQALAGIKHI